MAHYVQWILTLTISLLAYFRFLRNDFHVPLKLFFSIFLSAPRELLLLKNKIDCLLEFVWTEKIYVTSYLDSMNGISESSPFLESTRFVECLITSSGRSYSRLDNRVRGKKSGCREFYVWFNGHAFYFAFVLAQYFIYHRIFFVRLPWRCSASANNQIMANNW